MTDDRFFVGVDAGTTYVKTVIINEKNDLVSFSIETSGPDFQASIKTSLEEAIERGGLSRPLIKHITATGFGRGNVTFADSTKTEIGCHAKGVYHHFPKKLTIIDIGGQDTKVIRIDEKGKRLSFKMNRKCAAGTGAFLEEISKRLDIPIDEMNALATKSTKDIPLGSFCTIFATTEVITHIKDGEKVEDMLKSAYESIARRVIEMGVLDGTVVLTGGVVAHNTIIVDILGTLIGSEISTPPQPQLSGAFGAALFARENHNPE